MLGSQHSAAGHAKIASGGELRSKKCAGEGGKMQRGFGKTDSKVWWPLPMTLVCWG